MHAWICDEPTGPGSVSWREAPTPEPKPGEVRVAIRAASLNFPDLLIVSGKYQHKPTPPFVPGAEFSGVVEALGEGVTQLRVGDRVACCAGTGGFATHACTAAGLALPLPDEMPFDEAAAFIMTYGTSHHALVDRAQLRAGETVLVLGAAGGVGSAAVQIAKASGARVIAAASSDAKCAFATRLGADATIDYARANIRDELKRLTDGRGPDVVYDPVGGDLAEPVFRTIAWRGRYVVIGFAQGGIPALPWNLPLLKGASIVGVFWGSFMRHEPEAGMRALAELVEWYRRGLVRPVVGERLPMAGLRQAYDRMGSRQVMGKLVLVND